MRRINDFGVVLGTNAALAAPLEWAHSRGRRIGRKAERFCVAALNLLGELGCAAHLGGANRREVSRVAEEKDQAISGPFVKAERADLCVDSEIGSDVANVQGRGASFQLMWAAPLRHSM